MRRAKLASLVIASLGVALNILAGVLLIENVGSCPANQNCTHTLPGTSIGILPVVGVLEFVGLLSIGIGILLLLEYRNQTK